MKLRRAEVRHDLTVRLRDFGPEPTSPFDVSLWGAAGEGADESVQVGRAITACEEDGGGKVIFPPGTYAGNYTVADDGVILTGAGRATVLQGAADGPIVTFDNVSYCGMDDFFLDGEGDIARTGVLLDGSQYGKFSNLTGDGWADAMVDLVAVTQDTSFNTLEHIHATDAARLFRLSGNAAFTQRVMLNTIINASAIGSATGTETFLIDFVRAANDNHFVGSTYLELNFTDSHGVVFNSDSAAAIRAVYANHFDDLLIDQPVANTVSVLVNDTRVTGSGPFPNRVQLRLGGAEIVPVTVNANGFITMPGQIGSFLDAERPDPVNEIIGTQIFNTTTGTPNIAGDGTDWFEVDGTTT